MFDTIGVECLFYCYTGENWKSNEQEVHCFTKDFFLAGRRAAAKVYTLQQLTRDASMPAMVRVHKMTTIAH